MRGIFVSFISLNFLLALKYPKIDLKGNFDSKTTITVFDLIFNVNW